MTCTPRLGAVLAILLFSAASGRLLSAERRPLILLTNDDGIAAPGLAALHAELTRLGEVVVAAPAENQSGVGHSITYAEPIMVRLVEPPGRREGVPGAWYGVGARPATCVRLALASLLGRRPDLVVSGINRGENTGLALHVSGTLAAAREAAFDGIPSLGVSLAESEAMDYAAAASASSRLAREVLARGLPPGIFLAVNVPAGAIQGIKVVPHAGQTGRRTFERRESPYGQVYYWSLWTGPVDESLETDLGALARGYLTVTPLSVGANDASALQALESWRLSGAYPGGPGDSIARWP